MYGCDSVWRGGGGTDCFQLEPDIFTAFIDACAENDLIFFHNDNSWLLTYALPASAPWSYHSDSPAYYEMPLLQRNTSTTVDYARRRLGKRALLSYENNNGFPTPDLEYFESIVDPANTTYPVAPDLAWKWPLKQFPLRNGSNGWGISNQPWAWFEFVHTLTRQPYYAHGER